MPYPRGHPQSRSKYWRLRQFTSEERRAKLAKRAVRKAKKKAERIAIRQGKGPKAKG